MKTSSLSHRDIVVRKIPFEFPDDIDPIWNPGNPEWSHMVNGGSMTMPYLEPFLNRTMREAAANIDDEMVKDEIRGFVAQEAQHFRQHRRYNELLKQHYPELAAVEEGMQRDYDHMDAHWSLERRLAYSAGFETMTQGMTRWTVNQRISLFGGADTRIASFVLWHLVEEAEHKFAAFNAYRAFGGRYWRRALGVYEGAIHVMLMARRAYMQMFKRDGRWRRIGSRLRLWYMVMRLLSNLAPVMLRGMMPWYNPRQERDPEWVEQWIRGYTEQGETDAPPLLDTASETMPVPFASAS